MKADINVTPLVDIVLVLLIIFIVITPAVNKAVRLPAARHAPKPEGAGPLTLVLAARRDAAGAVEGLEPVRVDDPAAPDAHGLGLEPFTLSDPDGRRRLAVRIRQALAAPGERRVFIKADLDLPFRQVNDLLQVCREAGAANPSVVTREDRPSGRGGG
jgi:biopolymer transport protein ExbD